MTLTIHTISNRDEWNAAARSLPAAHILQSWEWGEFKRLTTGWQPTRLLFKRGEQVVAAASIGIRSIGPLRVMYIPKGPALDYRDAALVNDVFDALQHFARRNFAVWLKLDPDVRLGTGIPGEADEVPDTAGVAVAENLRGRGWRFSADQVQFRNTICLDLTKSEEELLAAMSQSARRKLRAARDKHGVTVRVATPDDLPTLYALYQVTGARDHFLIRPPEYYRSAWQTFMQAGLAHALIAEYDGQAIAHVILFHFGRTCWYFYGASADVERERMPNDLLQWEAMRWAKAQGYAVYDMWGAPDEFNESDPLWGVYQFKRNFRGDVVRHIGAWDYAPYPPLYWAYTQAWPRLLSWLRRKKG